MIRVLRASLLLAAMALPATATAQLVYDNGAPSCVGFFCGTPDNLGWGANDFTLTSASTISQVRFWGFSWRYNSTTQVADLSDGFRGTVSWRIYASAPNSGPTNVLFSGLGIPTVVDQGLIAQKDGAMLKQFDFTLSATLGAGTYWLALHNGTEAENTDGSFYWSYTALTGATYALNPQITGGTFGGQTAWDGAFQLYGTASEQNPPGNIPNNPPTSTVPEPSTYLLMASGLVATAVVARRRRTS